MPYADGSVVIFTYVSVIYILASEPHVFGIMLIQNGFYHLSFDYALTLLTWY